MARSLHLNCFCDPARENHFRRNTFRCEVIVSDVHFTVARRYKLIGNVHSFQILRADLDAISDNLLVNDRLVSLYALDELDCRAHSVLKENVADKLLSFAFLRFNGVASD